MAEFLFDEQPHTASFTCVHVVHDGAPVLLVAHDEDDGAWQFLCGGQNTLDDAVVVGMCHLVQADPTLNELHEMAQGWMAERDEVGGPWTLSPREPDDDD
ncbi:MAG: hypothetical protein FWE61_04165 [Micrococcales bacterium]|nr:hypothetical protein [Micrococcales bacterium]